MQQPQPQKRGPKPKGHVVFYKRVSTEEKELLEKYLSKLRSDQN
jgi:hypothetical protein